MYLHNWSLKTAPTASGRQNLLFIYSLQSNQMDVFCSWQILKLYLQLIFFPIESLHKLKHAGFTFDFMSNI